MLDSTPVRFILVAAQMVPGVETLEIVEIITITAEFSPNGRHT
jgi:hypothetical protein